MRRLLPVVFIILALFPSCSRGRDGESVKLVLRYADNQPEGHPAAEAAKYFASLVHSSTDGEIDVEVYLNGELGSETSIFEQVRFGGVDFSRFSIGTLPPDMGEYRALMYPFLYRDREHMWSVLDGDIGRRLLDDSVEYGIIALAWFDAGLRSLYTIEQIDDFSDFRGKTIRVQENDFIASIFETIGVRTVQIPYGSVYSALQMNRIDGAENNIPSYVLAGHYECAKYYMISRHMRTPEILAMSMQAVDKISAVNPEYVDVIKECARQSGLYERQLWVESEEYYMQIALDAGCVFAYPDKELEAQLYDAMTTIDYLLDEKERQLVEEIRNT